MKVNFDRTCLLESLLESGQFGVGTGMYYVACFFMDTDASIFGQM